MPSLRTGPYPLRVPNAQKQTRPDKIGWVKSPALRSDMASKSLSAQPVAQTSKQHRHSSTGGACIAGCAGKVSI